MADKRKVPRREWRSHNGQQEVKCASCGSFKPATRKYFYFQGRGGCRGPHSWCKPCYNVNSGRAAGMRCKVEIHEVPADIIQAQIGFVAMLAPVPVALFGAREFNPSELAEAA